MPRSTPGSAGVALRYRPRRRQLLVPDGRRGARRRLRAGFDQQRPARRQFRRAGLRPRHDALEVPAPRAILSRRSSRWRRSAGACDRAGREFGRIAVGGVADLTLLRIDDGPVTFTDSRGDHPPGTRRLEPVATVRAGRSSHPGRPGPAAVVKIAKAEVIHLRQDAGLRHGRRRQRVARRPERRARPARDDDGIVGWADVETAPSVARAAMDAPDQPFFRGIRHSIARREPARGRPAVYEALPRHRLLRQGRRRDPGRSRA